MTFKEALQDEEISYYDFYTALMDQDLGAWDDINSSYILYDYINEKMREGYCVSHILKAMESQYCYTDDWKISLDNSMNEPVAINTKEDLVEALGLDEEDLARTYTPRQYVIIERKEKSNAGIDR